MDFKTWIKQYGSTGRRYDVATEVELNDNSFPHEHYPDFKIEKYFDEQDGMERYIVSWVNEYDPTAAPDAAGADPGTFGSFAFDITNRAKGLKTKLPLIIGAAAALAIILYLIFRKK